MTARPLPAVALLSLLLPASAQDIEFFTVDEAPDGDGPIDLTYTVDGGSLLVLHQQSDDLTFLDPDSGAVEDVVAVGVDPYDLALTPDGALALTADRGSDTVTVVDVATRAVIATVPLTGARPYQIELTGDGLRAVVGLDGDGPDDSTVSVIDLSTFTEERSFATLRQRSHSFFMPNPGLSQLGFDQDDYPPFDLSPDDTTLLLPVSGLERVAAYDVTTGLELAQIPLVGPVVGVYVNADGSRAVAVTEGYVFDNNVWPIDMATFAAANPVKVDGFFYGDALVFLDLDRIALGSWDQVHFIDLANGTSSAAPLPGYAFDFELTADGQHIVATRSTNFWSETTETTVLDAGTAAVVAELEAGGRRLTLSPFAPHAAALELRIHERIHRLEIAGAASQVVGSGPTGQPIEGDAPTSVALAEEAGLLLTANTISENVAVIDVDSGQPLHWIPASGRPSAVVVQPSGRLAVARSDAGLDLIDPIGGVALDFVPLAEGPVERLLALAANGREVWAASEDAVVGMRIADGRLEHLVTHLLPGDFAIDIALSSRGLLALQLAQGGSYGSLLLYDTVSRAELALLDLASTRLEFAPDGAALYFRSDDELVELSVDGAVPKIERTLPIEVFGLGAGPEGRFLYVASHLSGNALHVIDLETWSVVHTLPSNVLLFDLEVVGPYAFTGGGSGSWRRYRADGLATTLIDELSLDEITPAPVFSARYGAVFHALPGKHDGVRVIDYTVAPVNYCGPANSNSTALPARIDADGWLVAGFPVTLRARDLPPHQFGYFLVGRTQGFTPFAGGGQGNLCLDPPLGRFVDGVRSSGQEGTLSIVADSSALPLGGGSVAALPGETWYFQAWFRDQNPFPTSNLTDGVGVTFR